MDTRFDKLSSWLFFELVLTVVGCGWYFYNYASLRYQFGDVMFYVIMFVLITRIYFLGRAWASLGGTPTVGTEEEPEVSDDSTPIDPISGENKI